MTKRPNPSAKANALWDLAETKPSADDFALRVRDIYDGLTQGRADQSDVRAFLVLQMSLMQHRELIGKNHRALAEKMLPKVARSTGRPKAALGRKAYSKRYDLYRDWVGEKAIRPELTKEQFAKERLGITKHDLEGDFEDEHRAKIDAILQELKPARMKGLDEGQKRALETIYPRIVTYPIYLAREWQEAKKRSPRLTKENFLQYEIFKWPRRTERHSTEIQIIDEWLEKLNDGEKQLADLVADQKQRALSKSSRSRLRRS